MVFGGVVVTERMMLGTYDDGDYHGAPHLYDSVCDTSPKCRDVGETRTMYLDPANGMIPHSGPHDENEFCEGAEPKCIVFDRHSNAQGGGSSALVGGEGAPKSKGAYDPPPAHYGGGLQIDPWAVWDAFDLDRYTANAVKYLLRAGKKDIAPRLDDLRKARNYIAKAIEMEENRE